MKFRTDGLKSVTAETKRLEKAVSDAFWDGNDSYGEDLQRALDYYYKLRDEGVIYDPAF